VKKILLLVVLVTVISGCAGGAKATPTDSAPTPVLLPAPPGMVNIPGGTFLMGSGDVENASPVRAVTISSFSIGRYPVTQKEWREVTGTDPSRFKGDDLPVETVTWFDAVEYCNRLSQMEDLTPAYTIAGRTPETGHPITGAGVIWNPDADGYRLPTEAEWEYAARGGNGSPSNFIYSGSDNIDEVAWYFDNSGGSTHPVGTKKPNALVLYDMGGNVQEWCWDWWGSYPDTAQTDPTGVHSAFVRVLRGGSWGNSAGDIRSVYRYHYWPNLMDNVIGFRIAKNGE